MCAEIGHRHAACVRAFGLNIDMNPACTDESRVNRDTDGERIGRVWSFRDVTERDRGNLERDVLREIAHGVATSADFQSSLQSMHRSLQRVFDAWGFERCLWGTDWTRAFAVVNYEQAVKPFLETKRLSDSERAMLMGGACAKAYGWSPKR